MVKMRIWAIAKKRVSLEGPAKVTDRQRAMMKADPLRKQLIKKELIAFKRNRLGNRKRHVLSALSFAVKNT